MKIAERMLGIERSLLRKIFDSAPNDSLNLGLGEIRFPTPRLLIKSGQKILENGYLGYTPNAGLFETRQVIADYYENLIDPDQVCVTNGAEEGIFASILSTVNPGDEVLLTDPCFVAYSSVIKMAGGIPVYIGLPSENSFELNYDNIKAKISPRTTTFLFSNPSNPLSKSFSSEERESIIKISRENNITIIADEIYRDLYYHQRSESFLESTDNVIVISGLSKSHCMTGWRLGWVATNNKSVLTAIVNAHQYISTCASYISQKVTVMALSEAGMATVNSLKNILKTNLEILLDFMRTHFTNFRFVEPDAAPYLFFTLGTDDILLAQKLAKLGIIVIPGRTFGSNGKGWIRMNYSISKIQLKKLFTKLSLLTI